MTYRIWLFRASVAVVLAVAWFQHRAAVEARRQEEFKQPPGEFTRLYHTAPDGHTVFRTAPRAGRHGRA